MTALRTYLIPLFLALLVLFGVNIYKWFPAWTHSHMAGVHDEDFEKEREKAEEAAGETLSGTLKSLLAKAITGDAPMVEATHERRDRYLKDANGDVRQAVLNVVNKRHGLSESTKSWLLKTIPFAGVPISVVRALWLQLRDTALIAALYGHDLYDKDVQSKIIWSLVSADTTKVEFSLSPLRRR